MFQFHTQRATGVCRLGFTLAELLIALAILGEIAVFTIPKIISAQQNGKRITVFKETIATISQLAYMANLQNDQNYVFNNVNAIKICTGNSATQGCFSQPTTDGESTQPGFILPNGATVAGFDYFIAGQGLVIDWNGPDGPNVYGDDQLDLLICLKQGTACSGGRQAGAVWTRDATSDALYQSIFK